MSATIITFPGVRAAVHPATPSQPQEDNGDTRDMGHKKPPPDKPQAQFDGRRKKDVKFRSVEPNFQVIGGENGRCSYRVQIRDTVAGKSISFTKTITQLPMARKWKKRKLAKIEIDGLEAG